MLIWVFDILWTILLRVTSWFTLYFVQFVSRLVCESFVHAYLLYVYFLTCLLSLIQYIGWTPSNPKWLRCAWNSISYQICTYLCGGCPMYCSCSNYFGPNEFGYHGVLDFVLGTLEMDWKLVSFSREVSSTFWLLEPSIGWSWNLISYINQCHPGNTYLPHAYISSFQPCVGCILAWNPFVAFHVVLVFISSKTSLLQMWESRDDYIWWWVFIVIFMIHLSQIC